MIVMAFIKGVKYVSLIKSPPSIEDKAMVMALKCISMKKEQARRSKVAKTSVDVSSSIERAKEMESMASKFGQKKGAHSYK